jgi:hypothetical protein
MKIKYLSAQFWRRRATLRHQREGGATASGRHVLSKAVWFGVAFAVTAFNRLANAPACQVTLASPVETSGSESHTDLLIFPPPRATWRPYTGLVPAQLRIDQAVPKPGIRPSSRLTSAFLAGENLSSPSGVIPTGVAPDFSEGAAAMHFPIPSTAVVSSCPPGRASGHAAGPSTG